MATTKQITPSNTGLVPIQHRLSIRSQPIFQALHQFECAMRVGMPGIVVANQNLDPFNADLQTVSVQPAIQEVMRVNAVPTLTTLPILDDVPICFPTAGGWSMTMPIAIGDECWLSFADMGIDMWWQSGGIQKQPDGKLYRHDIGDAVAQFGMRSNPRKLANYSTSSMQLRSDDGDVVIDLAAAGVKIMATGGTPQALVNQTWLTWFLTDIVPFLVSKGYAGPAMPAASATTILEAQ